MVVGDTALAYYYCFLRYYVIAHDSIPVGIVTLR